MEQGASIQNPYAGVTIPRAQLKSSFVRNTLGEDLDGVVITNTSVVPMYPTHITQEGFGNNNSSSNLPNGYKIHTQDSWRRPYNPYAGDKPEDSGHNNAMHSIDLDRQYKATSVEKTTCGCCSCCCPCCCQCCKCNPCCVIS